MQKGSGVGAHPGDVYATAVGTESENVGLEVQVQAVLCLIQGERRSNIERGWRPGGDLIEVFECSERNEQKAYRGRESMASS